MHLNERIAQARKKAGLTQEQLGEALGVSRQAVSKWESGQANPDVTYIMEMCRIFDVSADWILFGTEHKPSAPVPAEIPKGKKQHGYSLYLTDRFDPEAACLLPELFARSWVAPAFPWGDAEITGENIMVVADLTDFNNAVGSYTVPARILIETDGDIGITGTYQVRLNISEHPPEADPEEEGDAPIEEPPENGEQTQTQ